MVVVADTTPINYLVLIGQSIQASSDSTCSISGIDAAPSPTIGMLLPQLDSGESEAIAGRREATRRGVKVAGTRSPFSMKPIRPGSSALSRR